MLIHHTANKFDAHTTHHIKAHRKNAYILHRTRAHRSNAHTPCCTRIYLNAHRQHCTRLNITNAHGIHVHTLCCTWACGMNSRTLQRTRAHRINVQNCATSTHNGCPFLYFILLCSCFCNWAFSIAWYLSLNTMLTYFMFMFMLHSTFPYFPILIITHFMSNI